MPRLTRTQKYADLRASLTNDNETTNNSSQLDSFQQRLNELQEKANPIKETIVEEKVEKESSFNALRERIDELLKDNSDEDLINKAQEVAEMPKEIIGTNIKTDDIFITLNDEPKDNNVEETKVFTPINKEENEIVEHNWHKEETILTPQQPIITDNQEIVNEVVEAKEENKLENEFNSLPTIDQYFSVDNNNELNIDEAKVNELNYSITKEVKDLVEGIYNNNTEETITNIVDETNKLNDESLNVKVDNPLVFEEEKIEEVNTNLPIQNPAIDSKEEDGVEFVPYEIPISQREELRFEIKEEETKEEKPIEVIEEVAIENTSTLQDYENNKQEIGENYISATIDEVNQYNREEGEKLIDDIPVSIIDEVRNHVVTNDSLYSQNDNLNDNSEYIDTIEYAKEDEESLEGIMESYKQEVEPEEVEVKHVIDDIFNDINQEEEVVEDTASFIDEALTLPDHKEEVVFEDDAKVVESLETIQEEPKNKLEEITERIREEENKLNDINRGVINFEQVVQDKKEEVIDDMDDDEFSTTVSLQISKIMDELNDMTEEESIPDELIDVKASTPVDLDASSYDKKDVPDFISAFFNDDVSNEEDADYYNEHPTLAISQEQEFNSGEVVEIKNISELDDAPVTRTFEETKPFVVDEEVEFVEDSTPNKILNIILVALILVLLAVLGVILYYILMAKGII